MTGKERFLAMAKGRTVDQKPLIDWPRSDPGADGRVYPAGVIAESYDRNSPRAGFAFIPNLYRQIEMLGELPVATMKNGVMQEVVEEASALHLREARAAIKNGAVGVFYEIHGADASKCTPMEYGGLFLERDRAFLESVSDAPCNFIYINGKEPYLDFVSDLPATIFAWDAKGSGIPVAEVRKMRKGLLAADDPDADIQISANGSITDFLEGVLTHA